MHDAVNCEIHASLTYVALVKAGFLFQNESSHSFIVKIKHRIYKKLQELAFFSSNILF